MYLLKKNTKIYLLHLPHVSDKPNKIIKADKFTSDRDEFIFLSRTFPF